MIKKSVRLQPVKKMAEDKAKQAATDMVSARNSHQTQEQKLQELVSYRIEYIEQYQTRAKNGIQSGQLQQYQQFISQLDMAIKQQKITVAQSNGKLTDSTNHWRDKHSHKRAINKAVNRFKVSETRAQDKIEQNSMDEHNTRKHNEKTKTEQ